MKKKTISLNRQPRLDVPFTKWLTESGFTSERFRDLAARHGVKLNLSTILKWRIGTKPRKATILALERNFRTIKF